MVRALFMKDIRLIRKNFAVMAVMIIGMPIFPFWNYMYRGRKMSRW